MEDVFSSRAKFRVLRLLANFKRPSYIREISCLTKTPPRSIQLAAHELTRIKVLRKFKSKNRIYFQLNQEFLYHNTLSDFFSYQVQRELEDRSKQYSQIALNALEFIDNFYAMMTKARQ